MHTVTSLLYFLCIFLPTWIRLQIQLRNHANQGCGTGPTTPHKTFSKSRPYFFELFFSIIVKYIKSLEVVKKHTKRVLFLVENGNC
jgi:hypothetical protein